MDEQPSGNGAPPWKGAPRTQPGTTGSAADKRNAYGQAQIDAEAAQLRAQGYTFREIGERMGCSLQTASDRVRRAIAAVPVEAVTQLRKTQLSRFDFQRRVALRLLATDHPLIQNGRVIMREVTDPETGLVRSEPVVDINPKFRALAELRKIEEGVSALTGTAAPRRVEVNVISEDAIDAEIKKLESELGDGHSGRGTSGQAALPSGPTEAES